MKRQFQQNPATWLSAVILVAITAFGITSRAQVTPQQITNGLVAYYPLTTINSDGLSTPDLVSRRDLSLVNMNINNLVADTHPGIESGYVLNFTNSWGPPLAVYQSSGQNPLDGSGDYFPFINQRGATMNFWIKGPVPATRDLRVFAECANNADNNPFFSFSDQPSSRTGLGLFLRENAQTTDPNGITVNQMPDGTYQLPSYFYVLGAASPYTTNTLFDNNWHMFTAEIETNGDFHVFVDGNYDPGDQSYGGTFDHEGNPAIIPPLPVTNTYYTTNLYPLVNPPASNPPPNGFVRWMIPGLNQAGAFTAFGGYDRNGTIAAGPPIRLSDIGFWNRTLTTDEIRFVFTNGVGPIPMNTNVIRIVQFYQSMPEVGQGGEIRLTWQVQGATNISITGIGSNLPASGTATVTANANQTYTFTLMAENGSAADIRRPINVKVLSGVASNWQLIQRFDGVYTTTTNGIQNFPGNSATSSPWQCLVGNYAGTLDRFNVVSLPTGGQSGLVLSPRSGYAADTVSSTFGYDSKGAVAWGFLNDYSVHPYDVHTVFFRFAVRNPGSLAANYNIYSGLDFAFGLTDFGFGTGPLGGANPPGAGTVGPGFKIISCDTTGALQLKPFDLLAANYNGSNYLGGYDYITDAVNGNPGGLLTNVTYMAWLDVSNDNTHAATNGGVAYTANEPKFGLWLQRQGGTQVQLFSGFGGDRDWAFPYSSTYPANILDKIFVSVGTEDCFNGDWACFLETNNMIVLDDFYLSKNGYDHTIPRLFQIASIARAPTTATINWYSLGSMFQINTYSVQRKFNLTDPVWTTLTNGLPSGGDFTSYTDKTVGSAPTAFYRITWP